MSSALDEMCRGCAALLKRQQRQHGCTSCLHVPCRCSTGQRGGQRCIASTLYSFVSHTRIGRHPADRSPGLSPGLTPKRKKQRRLNTFNIFRLRNSRSTPPALLSLVCLAQHRYNCTTEDKTPPTTHENTDKQGLLSYTIHATRPLAAHAA